MNEQAFLRSIQAFVFGAFGVIAGIVSWQWDYFVSELRLPGGKADELTLGLALLAIALGVVAWRRAKGAWAGRVAGALAILAGLKMPGEVVVMLIFWR